MAPLKPSLLLCMLACLCISPFVPAQGAVESDFFYLNLVWPGSYCNTGLIWKKCCMPTTAEPAVDFFVESMETYDSYTGNVVTDCNKTCTFYVNQLRPFIEDMYSYWPDVTCPSNNGVTKWKSTFCKYGPCSNLTQAEYFKQALTLRENLNIRILLATKGIVPSNTAMYYLEDIESTLRAKLSFSFVVECNKNGLFFAQSQLLRIKICISANGKNIISCPIDKQTNCDSKVKFPLFTYDMLGHDAIDESNPIKMPFDRDQVI
ncbi:ribonuclease 1-like [Carex rostrata]